jgi:hypothetical protein
MRARPWQLPVAVFLLWLLFAQSVASATRLSITTDEGLHITSGYSYLRTGDLRLIEEHPPLVKVLEAWPLLLLPDLGSPAETTGWEQGNLNRVTKFFLLRYRPFDRLLFSARVPTMLMSLLLGAFVFRWAADLLGPGAGVLALALYAFDPNIVAHSAIAATDLGAACFIFIACYFFWRYLRRPGWSSILLAGVTLGLAEAAKISALMLLPLFGALWLAQVLTRSKFIRKETPRLGPSWKSPAVLLLIAFLTFWAVFGFELRSLTFDIWKSPSLGGLKFEFPMPAASYLTSLNTVQAHLSAGRPTFLLGMNSEQGWWYYFPVAFALKTPLPTLILLIAALIGVGAQILRLWQNGERRELAWQAWRYPALLSFPLIYFVASLTQPFNIGYRHLLPMLPFTFVFIGQISNPGIALKHAKSRISNVKRHSPDVDLRSVTLSPCLLVSLSPCLLVLALVAWCAVGTAAVFPHYLAYFNELAGGPAGGYHYLVDSNLDWGQGWKELKTYMNAHGIGRIKFAQFSSNDPATYGIDYEPIAPMMGAPPVLPARFNPAPSVYVLSASSLQGVPLADINTYDTFRHRPPTARIGYALFVYDVRPVEPLPGWVASCADPAPPLEPEDIAEGFGRSDLRLVYFDCSQTFVLPGNTARGWIVLPYALAHDRSAFVARWLNQASLVYEQKQSFRLPPHSIFLTSDQAKLPGLSPLTASFGQTAELMGFQLDRSTARPGQSVELLTLWRVTGQPPEPLSIMAHLVSADGRAIGVGDGLGLATDQWQVGDVFAQRSLLQLPADAPPGTLWAQTGLYTLDGLQRLPVKVNGAVVGDSLQLAALSVTP